MKYISLPEFGSPEDFVDMHDIVKKTCRTRHGMDCIDSKVGKHGARSNTTIHGALDQGSNNITSIKCQNS
jgi:hypothetical protein